MTPDLAALLAELEIKTVNVRAYRGPGTTMSTACIESMLRQYGYAHTKLVLLSIVDTKNNARELVAPTIWAVSDLVRTHPGWARRVSDWLAAFDKVDLGQLRKFAKRNKAVKVRAGLCSILFGFLSAEMDRPQKPAERVTKGRGRQAARMAA